MSRLQVGVLALIVGYTVTDKNLGKVVTLDSYIGDVEFEDGDIYYGLWKVVGDCLLRSDGDIYDFGYVESKNLMPLGDKKTQDELAKEKWLEVT